jgi:hypothetical protein
MFNKNNLTNGARISYYFGATEFVPDESGVRVIHFVQFHACKGTNDGIVTTTSGTCPFSYVMGKIDFRDLYIQLRKFCSGSLLQLPICFMVGSVLLIFSVFFCFVFVGLCCNRHILN